MLAYRREAKAAIAHPPGRLASPDRYYPAAVLDKCQGRRDATGWEYGVATASKYGRLIDPI